ncbi:MAG: putative sulfate/molybdate transporter [Candidatus Latescibacterota bacterium]|nr:MAG: putative sulfate/molybdate transporter [Candidatus Latescibacterota bacterium]
MRFNLVELSGAVGDLGTFLPLAAGMAFVTGLDFGIILIFAGLANIFAGVIFGLPVAVQPMKAIAAVAIAETLTPGAVAAAGIVLGAIMLVVGLTRLVNVMERVVPLSVVRGIQVGVGVKLMLQAFDFVRSTPRNGPDSVTVAVVLGVALIISHGWKRFPGALLVFVAGLAVAFWQTPALFDRLAIGAPQIDVIVPKTSEWLTGVARGAIPQLPLTILNSVLAVCVLSGDLFPKRRIAAPRMAASVGLINVLGCWFGAIPLCHGSGGLAAQYHFGARTGGAMVMLGIVNLLVGLLVGGFAVIVIQAYPVSFLGVMLFFAGLELALPARDQTDTRGFAVVVITLAGTLAVNTLAGFLMGIAVHLLMSRRRTAR